MLTTLAPYSTIPHYPQSHLLFVTVMDGPIWCLHRLLHPYRVLDAELEAVLLSKAAQLGLPAEWVSLLDDLDPERRQVCVVGGREGALLCGEGSGCTALHLEDSLSTTAQHAKTVALHVDTTHISPWYSAVVSVVFRICRCHLIVCSRLARMRPLQVHLTCRHPFQLDYVLEW